MHRYIGQELPLMFTPELKLPTHCTTLGPFDVECKRDVRCQNEFTHSAICLKRYFLPARRSRGEYGVTPCPCSCPCPSASAALPAASPARSTRPLGRWLTGPPRAASPPHDQRFLQLAGRALSREASAPCSSSSSWSCCARRVSPSSQIGPFR